MYEFPAEVGDISRFSSPKELQKLAGLALVESSSGKDKGRTKISRRGRRGLRYLLFEVAMSLVGKKPEFGMPHHYYTTRRTNPLMKMQSLMAVAAKLIRVFYVMLTKGVEYNPSKRFGDITWPTVYAVQKQKGNNSGGCQEGSYRIKQNVTGNVRCKQC